MLVYLNTSLLNNNCIIVKFIEITHVLGRRSRHVNPGLREECAGSEHEDDVEDRMDWILEDVAQRLGRREVVAEAADRVGATAAAVGPDSQKVDEEVSGEFDRHHLRDDVHVGDECWKEKN